MKAMPAILLTLAWGSASAAQNGTARTCEEMLVGAWQMESPRIYAADGQHFGGERWQTVFHDDGTFAVTGPEDGATGAGTWSAATGRASDVCVLTMIFPPDAPPARMSNTPHSEWLVDGPDSLRRIAPAEAYARRVTPTK